MAASAAIEETEPVATAPEEERPRADPYAILTPFDAEVLLKQHPELAEKRPELVYLRSQRDYYLTDCNGLYKEGMRAVFKRDLVMLNFLWPYATKTENAGKQWQSVMAFAYNHALEKAVIVLLDWLNDKGILYNVKTIAEDVLKTKNQDLHRWFAKTMVHEKVQEMDSHFYLTSGAIEAAPSTQAVAPKERKQKKEKKTKKEPEPAIDDDKEIK